MTFIKRAAFGLAILLPAAAFAQTALDTNEDGLVSIDEVQAVYPDVTADAFMAADMDGDALLNEEELAAAVEAGTIPSEDDAG